MKRNLLVTAAILLLCIPPAIGADSQPAASGSLEPVLREAQELARKPEQSEAAIQAYESIVETHMANQKAFNAALRELADTYEKSGKAEEGVRFFYKFAQELESSQGDGANALQGAIGGFLAKHSDLLTKVNEEAQSASVKRQAPAPISLDLEQAILQRENAALREESVQKVKAMLAATSSDEQKFSGLSTLNAVRAAKFDRKPFLPLVLPLLKHEDGDIRYGALASLPSLEAPTEELPGIAAMAHDPSPRVRAGVASTLVLVARGQHAEIVIPALTELLQDEETTVIEQTLRSLWGQYSSPEFDALLIELSNDQQYSGLAIYHALSTMKTKSVAVCERLVEELADPDWNNSGRAAWGLTYGVQEEAKAMVEEGLLKALPQENNTYTRGEEMKALGKVASEKSRPYLQSVINSNMETDEIKEAAKKILAKLDGKQ